MNPLEITVCVIAAFVGLGLAIGYTTQRLPKWVCEIFGHQWEEIIRPQIHTGKFRCKRCRSFWP